LTRQREQFGDVLERLRTLADSNDKRLTEVRVTLEAKLKSMQEDNAKSLEQMRQTVDEKLQGTLERRLGESFKLVSDRLEAVYKGLGEMQTLATGVGDLKRVLTNVKMRGTWGEVQLGRMLEEVLTPEQYDTNVSTKATRSVWNSRSSCPGVATTRTKRSGCLLMPSSPSRNRTGMKPRNSVHAPAPLSWHIRGGVLACGPVVHSEDA